MCSSQCKMPIKTKNISSLLEDLIAHDMFALLEAIQLSLALASAQQYRSTYLIDKIKPKTPIYPAEQYLWDCSNLLSLTCIAVYARVRCITCKYNEWKQALYLHEN